MDKAGIATNEQMKAEAVSRMKLLGLKQEFIDAFDDEEACEITVFWSKWVKGFEPYPIEDEELDAVMDFEKSNPGLAWAVIHDITNEDGEDWDGYYILYVGDNPQKWEDERKELLEGSPLVYFKSVSSESYTVHSGFDTIKAEVHDGILIGAV